LDFLAVIRKSQRRKRLSGIDWQIFSLNRLVAA
jgi:hypothetical protein